MTGLPPDRRAAAPAAGSWLATGDNLTPDTLMPGRPINTIGAGQAGA